MMRMLVTDTWELTGQERDWLLEQGIEVEICRDDAPYEGDASRFELVACKFLFSYTPIERFTNLKYIQLYMAGFDHVPMDYIREHGIEFHNARDVYSIPIAEFAIGGVLALYKKFRDFDREQRTRQWNVRRYLGELYGKQVLIAGAGSIGAAFARRFRGFDCHVTGLARTAGERDGFDRVYAMDRLDSCLKDADILVLALPSNQETYHIINERRLALMKPEAVLVNICRGAVVDEPALVDALQSGRLAGAVLDAFETEPLPQQSPLWDMENVIVTPHTSYGAENNHRRIIEVMNRNLLSSPILGLR
ncbi:MAG: D-2-hydroxyacid dehydrogenase [Oscillospiraceae bacterium]|nr:D-2-hydroxyacid dehydrogenase [Oscillospiraceae bacterium]